MTKCLQCQSERVTKGTIVDSHRGGTAGFRPEGLRDFALTFKQGPHLSDRAHACLDCGLVWTSTDKTELNVFMRQHCD